MIELSYIQPKTGSFPGIECKATIMLDGKGMRKGKKRKNFWASPGGPGVKTPRSHCRGRGFNPWSGS